MGAISALNFIYCVWKRRDCQRCADRGQCWRSKQKCNWYADKQDVWKALYRQGVSLSITFGKLFNDGIHIVTGLRSNMKQRLISIYNKLMLRKRSIIESPNDTLKNKNNLYTFTTVAYIIFRWTCFLQWRHIVFSMSSRRLTSTLT